MQLVRCTVADRELIRDMQQVAFAELLEKYQDYDMSPATETLEKISWKITHPGSFYYFIRIGEKIVGGIRIVDTGDGSRKRISPLYIMPDHRGEGICPGCHGGSRAYPRRKSLAAGYHSAGSR